MWNELGSIASRPRAIDGRVNAGAYHFISVIDPDLDDGIEVSRHTFFPIPYRHGPRIEALIEQAVAAAEAAP